MADANMMREGEGEGEEQAPKKKGMNPVAMLMIGIVGTVIVGALGFAAYKALTAKPDDAAQEETQEKSQSVYFGKIFPFEDPIIVNLAGTKGQRYLKVSIQFEVTDDNVVDELKARQPLILDLLIGILSSKTIEDVSNTVGRNRLRREIIDKSNAELVSGKVINVYFTEFVVQ